MDLAGNPINVANRVSWSHQMTLADLTQFSKEAWLSGSDGWNPVVGIPPDPSADFDGDGDIDSHDFLVWQRGFGSTSQSDNSAGDANFDGTVNSEDLTIWQSQFGNFENPLYGAAVSVPEPNTFAILGTLGMIIPSLTYRSHLISKLQFIIPGSSDSFRLRFMLHSA